MISFCELPVCGVCTVARSGSVFDDPDFMFPSLVGMFIWGTIYWADARNYSDVKCVSSLVYVS